MRATILPAMLQVGYGDIALILCCELWGGRGERYLPSPLHKLDPQPEFGPGPETFKSNVDALLSCVFKLDSLS